MGGNEEGVEPSTVHLAGHQRFQWLHIHIRNRMGKTGTVKGGRGAATDTSE
jgi:hypothetical protein